MLLFSCHIPLRSKNFISQLNKFYLNMECGEVREKGIQINARNINSESPGRNSVVFLP